MLAANAGFAQDAVDKVVRQSPARSLKQAPDLGFSVHFDKDRAGVITFKLVNLSRYKVGIYDGTTCSKSYTLDALDRAGGKIQVLPPPLKPGLVERFSGSAAVLAPGESRSYDIIPDRGVLAVKGRKFVIGVFEVGTVNGRTLTMKSIDVYSKPFSVPEAK